MELSIWAIVKASVEWLFFPLMAIIAFFARKHIQKVEAVEKRVNHMDVKIAIVETNVSNIKKGIDKILDKL